MLNDKLDLDQLAEEFKKKENCGIIEVKNYLDPSFASEICDQIHKIPKVDWKYHFRDTNNPEEWIHKTKPHVAKGVDDLFRAKYNYKISNFIIENQKLNSEDKYSYFYEQSAGHGAVTRKNSDILIEFKDFLGGKSNLSFLSKVFGKKISVLKESNVTKYKSGYFKCAESENKSLPKYKLQFILNLTPHWSYSYGGLINYMTKDKFTLLKTVSPYFNTLIIAKTLSKGSIPYQVTSVAPHITKEKLFYNCYFG